MVVAIFEILGIVWFFGRAFVHVVHFHCAKEYKAYYSLHCLFAKTLPEMSYFSGIGLLSHVHPSLIYTDYLHEVHEHWLSRERHGVCLLTLYFVALRLLYLVVGVGAFTVKLLAVAFRLCNRECVWYIKWFGIVALLNQCTGCISLEKVLQDRLFLFIFGGRDSMYQAMETALRNVYLSRLAKQIWVSYWQRSQRLKAIVLLSTFDHNDLQCMLIEEMDAKEFEDALSEAEHGYSFSF